MSEPLCRCGRERQQHEPRPANWYSTLPVPCRAYQPMDFAPFERELSGEDGMGCHCDLCNQLKYAASPHRGRDWVPFANALHDALVGGTHVYRSWSEWTEKLKADSAAELRRMADETPAAASAVVVRRATDETPSARHAPGTAILCLDCRAKGHSVCMGEETPQTAVERAGES